MLNQVNTETLPSGMDHEHQHQEARRRSRRTYSCGRCKRYKIKCNMELPCRLCVSAKRELECFLHPPNPPSEEEKTKIARRRLRNLRNLRNLRPNELEQLQASKTVQPKHRESKSKTTKSGSTSLAATGESLSLASPSNLLALSQGSSPKLQSILVGDQLQMLYLPEAGEPVPVKAHTGVNIHGFLFLQGYANECKGMTIAIARPALMRWKQMVATVNTQELAMYFRKYYYWAHGGTHEVMDVAAILTVAHNMVHKIAMVSEHANWLIDKYLLQRMALACLILAEGEVIEGSALRAAQWLEIAREIKDILGPYRLVGDCIFLSQWIIQAEVPYLALNTMYEYSSLFEEYMAIVLTSEEFVFYLHLHEQTGPDSDSFLACARVWLIIKLIEIELSVLQPLASLQYKWAPLRNTIVPDKKIIERVYGVDLTLPLVDLSAFNMTIFACHQFFGRFEQARLQRDIIYVYLSLYGNVSALLRPAADSLCSIMAGPIDMAVLSKNSEAVAAVLVWKFLLIRWLSVVRADAPHFPSLRFANYISTIMLIFNIFNELDDRLSLPPGAMLDTILKGSHMIVVIQMYNSICLQAIFVATIAPLLRPGSKMNSLDLEYVFHVVMASLKKALAKLRISYPFSQMPLIATIIQAVDVLYATATNRAIIASTPHHFSEQLRSHLPADIWNSFILFVFGNNENYDNHIQQLWRLGEFAIANGANPIPITSNLVLNTDFLRQYETAYIPFWYTPDILDGYMLYVVDRLPA